MGLMLPKGSLGIPQNNFLATPSLTLGGTTVTSHATINTKGSYAQLFATTNFEVYGVSLQFFGGSTPNTQVQMLFDLAVGAAASEVVIVSNLFCQSGATSEPENQIFIPLRIPAGTRISARCQSNVTVKTVTVNVALFGGGAAPWQTFRACDAIGADTATSGGLAHTAGSTGAESTWTNIGSTLARDYFALYPMVQPTAASHATGMVIHLEIGIASTTLAEFSFRLTNNEMIGNLFPRVPLYGRFPLGTQMQIRGECNGTADSLYYAILGCY